MIFSFFSQNYWSMTDKNYMYVSVYVYVYIYRLYKMMFLKMYNVVI